MVVVPARGVWPVELVRRSVRAGHRGELGAPQPAEQGRTRTAQRVTDHGRTAGPRYPRRHAWGVPGGWRRDETELDELLFSEARSTEWDSNRPAEKIALVAARRGGGPTSEPERTISSVRADQQGRAGRNIHQRPHTTPPPAPPLTSPNRRSVRIRFGCSRSTPLRRSMGNSSDRRVVRDDVRPAVHGRAGTAAYDDHLCLFGETPRHTPSEASMLAGGGQ
jgi:hypothetical protein